MTDEEILELVNIHFGEVWCEEDGWGWAEFCAKPDALRKFALAIHEDGYNKGYEEGYDLGCFRV